jgi:hypothetical protein
MNGRERFDDQVNGQSNYIGEMTVCDSIQQRQKRFIEQKI